MPCVNSKHPPPQIKVKQNRKPHQTLWSAYSQEQEAKGAVVTTHTQWMDKENILWDLNVSYFLLYLQ